MNRRIPVARWGIYGFLLGAALFFLLPAYVMLVTSLKSMDEIRLGHIFALPGQLTLEPWISAWSSACTGLNCEGIRGGFWNSVGIVIPSTVLPILLGALNGYALSFWRPRGSQALFAVLMAGEFFPAQVTMYPLIQILDA